MKLDEILGKPLPFEVERNSAAQFQATFTAGEREILFYAENEDFEGFETDDAEWQIAFGEKTIKKTPRGDEYVSVDYDKTNNGKEFEVFATLKAILEKFIKERKPTKIMFSADKDKKNNRARLYAKLFKKNLPAGWSMEVDSSPVAHEPVLFSIVKEGMMKRSDPYISGEKSGIRPPPEKFAPRPTSSATKSKLETLVKKSGKSMEKVQAAWNKAAKEVADGPHKWSKVMQRVKADLGISI